MRFLNFFACFLLVGTVQAQDLAGTQWQLYPGAAAMGVGPNQGDIGWWSNNEGDVTTRACLFDDIYSFNADGSFQNILGADTWNEGWQGVAEGCGAPVAPHDGSGAATWTSDGSSITLDGTGAFMGLAKVHNGGELGNPADAPGSITYQITSLTNDAMTLDIHYQSGWWRFRFVPAGTELGMFDLTLEVNTANIEVGQNGMYAGGGVLGDAQAVALSDDNGDGIWSGTVSLPEGTSGNYVFLNSPANGWDWNTKENLEGLDCADGQYNDRLMAPLTENTTISTCFGQCTTDGTCNAPAETFDVTFKVDMSYYGGSYTTVNLNGTFNGWCGGCTEMSDADADGVYEVVVALPAGPIEYKFTVDGWGGQESFDGSETCTTPPAEFVNRAYEVSGAAELDVVCYDSCEACPDQPPVLHEVTFNVNMNNETVAETGVYLAGGGNFGSPGDNEMTDPEGDGIYSITVTVPEGFSSHYTFTNGACGDWSCKENLTGLECGDGTNYWDRFLSPITGPTTVSTCFGECSTDGTCAPPPAVFYDVTFNCNTANIEVGANGLFLGGGMFGDAMAHAMSDDDNDGVYTVTVSVAENASGYYIFLNSPNDGGDWSAKENLIGQPCGDPGNYHDRFLPTVTDDTTISTCWEQCGTDGTCEAPPVMVDVSFAIDMNYTGFPNADYDNIVVNGNWNNWAGWGVHLMDDDGDGIFTGTLNIEEGASFEFVIAATGPADSWSGWGSQFNAPEECSVAPNNYGATAAEGLVIAYCAGSCSATCATPGCTDPFYAEFDINATADDGSCSTPVVFGCIYEAADNYNSEANTDDGSCAFTLNACPGDLDGDGLVATPDLLTFLSVFGTNCE